jgi:hypothetical protein
VAGERAQSFLLDERGPQLHRPPQHFPVRASPLIQTPVQWTTLGAVFYFKQPATLEYEGRKLVEDAASKANWEPQEEFMLSQIVK